MDALPALPALSGKPFPALPAQLEAHAGANRNTDGSAQLHARSDREAIAAWLANYAASPHMLASYVREADRLYLWAALRGQTISDLMHEDMLLYRAFLADPQPAAEWISARKHPRSSAEWRPFCAPLSASSIKLALSVVNALFSWLVEARYLRANPLSLSRAKRSGGQIGRAHV